MKKLFVVGLLVLALVTLSGCVAGPNPQVNTPNEEGRVAGFWQGLWHGIIAPVTFIISLFSENVHVFETHNNGNWYVFGFLLGITLVWGGGGRGSARRR
jgi:4-amino-4-deoxy-L-arabinose transferase-like glycosyltransferase